ncbi:MAG: calcium:proton antiporter [Gammaproteobacteria bacterium]|jgi:Ca2+:H+ antiporter
MSSAGALRWPWIWPVAAWAVVGFASVADLSWIWIPVVVGLIGAVLAAVHHAEVIAERVGEPYGTLVLAVAVTVIEVALIVSLMIADDTPNMGLPRDTVYAAVMIILTGMVGLCLFAGSLQHNEQTFSLHGVSAALATLAALAVLTMVLPSFTTSSPGATYSPGQLGFVALVSLLLYAAFVLVQTVRNRDYFLDELDPTPDAPGHGKAARQSALGWTLLALVASLVAVVLLAKALAPGITASLDAIGAPEAATGVFIAALVLLPESLAAFRAARANRLQTSLNLAIGSALASIGLTIPVVAVLSLVMGWTLELGLDSREVVLLALALLVSTLSLGTGRTTLLHGAVHLVIFGVFLFTTIVP